MPLDTHSIVKRWVDLLRLQVKCPPRSQYICCCWMDTLQAGCRKHTIMCRVRVLRSVAIACKRNLLLPAAVRLKRLQPSFAHTCNLRLLLLGHRSDHARCLVTRGGFINAFNAIVPQQKQSTYSHNCAVSAECSTSKTVTRRQGKSCHHSTELDQVTPHKCHSTSIPASWCIDVHNTKQARLKCTLMSAAWRFATTAAASTMTKQPSSQAAKWDCAARSRCSRTR